MEKIYAVSSGALALSICQTGHGLSVCSIRDGGQTVLSTRRPLFSVTVESGETGERSVLCSDRDFPGITFSESESEWIIRAESGSSAPQIRVTIRISAHPSRNRLEWFMEVCSISEIVFPVSCDYPSLWFDVTPGRRFLSPFGCGETMEADNELFHHAYHRTGVYPSYGACFSFMSAWDPQCGRMIYYGIEDPDAATKQFSFLREEQDDAVCLRASFLCPRCGGSGNRVKLSGVCVWQTGDGDWYDSALVYRSFLEQSAPWMKRSGPWPTWMDEIDLWWLVHLKEDGPFAEEIIEATRSLNVNAAVHLYLWHQIPFDNDYPHYFPEKPFVRGEVQKLQQAGIRVVPYINGRLWDTRDRGAEDWQFSRLAFPSAAKDRFGSLFLETYDSKEEDGSPVKLAVMCPSAWFWRDTLREVTDRLIGDLGFDGVYLDQIGAAPPVPCSDPAHSHPAGGGNWWCSSYSGLIRNVRRNHPDCVLMTESNAEPFLSDFQGFLCCMWTKNNQVPAFPVLYSDRIHLFGVTMHDPSYDDIIIAQTLLFGVQMGWIPPSAVPGLPHRDFFRKAVALRKTLHGVLSHGRMLRPPLLADDAPRLRSEKSPHAYKARLDYPAVQGAQWMESETGNRYIILVNAGESEAATRIHTDFPDGDYPLFGDLSGTVSLRNGEAVLRIPGLSVLYWFCSESGRLPGSE
ncbi:MAG: hypothetical protein II719_00935 [Clostridia bacterium]|nr:hypothetical protein [Clostridia bacterium]